MKRITLTIFFMLSLKAFAQQQAQANKFKFKYVLNQKKLDRKGYKLFNTTDKKDYFIASRKLYAIAVVNKEKQYLELDIFKIKKETENLQQQLQAQYEKIQTQKNTTVNNNYVQSTSPIGFAIYWGDSLNGSRKKLSDPVKVYTLPYRGWSFGINSIILKYRPQVNFYKDSAALNNTTISNINLGLNFGYTRGFTHFTARGVNNFSVSFLYFAGPTICDIKKETSKDPRIWTAQKKPQNIGGLSTGFNFILARNNIGVMIAAGKDFGIGKRSNEWMYQGKTWFGLGVATNFTF